MGICCCKPTKMSASKCSNNMNPTKQSANWTHSQKTKKENNRETSQKNRNLKKKHRHKLFSSIKKKFENLSFHLDLKKTPKSKRERGEGKSNNSLKTTTRELIQEIESPPLYIDEGEQILKVQDRNGSTTLKNIETEVNHSYYSWKERDLTVAHVKSSIIAYIHSEENYQNENPSLPSFFDVGKKSYPKQSENNHSKSDFTSGIVEIQEITTKKGNPRIRSLSSPLKRLKHTQMKVMVTSLEELLQSKKNSINSSVHSLSSVPTSELLTFTHSSQTNCLS